MEGVFTFLSILFVFWFWFSLSLTPIAIYLNIKKENIEDPRRKMRYRKWGIICLVLGPVSLLFLVPIIAYMRLFIFELAL